MKVKHLIKWLKDLDQDADVIVSSDEELNTLYADLQISKLDDMDKETYVIWGNSGSEIDE